MLNNDLETRLVSNNIESRILDTLTTNTQTRGAESVLNLDVKTLLSP